ncbi:Gfo/Idh/MocA family protein [Streptomyces sp. NPDC059255]|uniref:Gfo/Idh/MocA family protein n=1 Tax=Streptomyces sp. NPDC059255 TaxID=3346793 RepID=UPI00367980C1
MTGGLVRLGVVGCGWIGAQHVKAWEQVARATSNAFTIAAVCDSDVERARSCAAAVSRWQERPVRVHTQLAALLGDGVDGVDICVPTHLHESAARAALGAGAHVLIEKPLAPSMDAAVRIARAAASTDRIVSLGENHRRTLTVRTLRWLLRDMQLLGVPELVQAQRVRYEAPSRRRDQWRSRRVTGGGGWAIDNGAHLLDTLTYVLGSVESVTAQAKRLRVRPCAGGPTEVDEREDFLTALLRFESGITGVFSCVSSLPGADDFRFAIRGTHAALIDNGTANGELFHAPEPTARVHEPGESPRPLAGYFDDYRRSLSDADRERLFPYGLTDDFAIECAEFLRAVQGGGTVEIGPDAAMRTLATSLAFYESAAAGHTVCVADVLAGTVHAYQDTIRPGPLSGDFAEHCTVWPLAAGVSTWGPS